MKITVIGSGYVGLVTAACFADQGNTVFCLDSDEKKIEQLNSGVVPIYEPGLEELILRNRSRLIFSRSYEKALSYSEVFFIAVGTPQNEDGSADMEHVSAVASTIGQLANKDIIVVNKSTVPVGSAALVKKIIQDEFSRKNIKNRCTVLSNPEFLKEGVAVNDFLRPDRVIVGYENDDYGNYAKEVIRKLYEPMNRNHDRMIFMDIASAELTKYAANAMLATRISFMNEMAKLAELTGADIEMVRKGIGSDTRIGYDFLYAGLGYGGSCFPKDVKALMHTFDAFKLSAKILNAVDDVNTQQRKQFVNKVKNLYNNDLRGLDFAIWGLSFKPNTDDVREAPSRYIISELLKSGANVKAYDPVANQSMRSALKVDLQANPNLLESVTFMDSEMDVLENSDCLLVLTEWKIFRSPDFQKIKEKMRGRVICDGRNIYDPKLINDIGFEYMGIGRN